MMATSALARSRGAAVLNTTEGLFFIFTLLCLVCLSSSLIGKNQLEMYKEDYKELQQEWDEMKAEEIYELLNDYQNVFDQLTALMKKTEQVFPGTFTPEDIDDIKEVRADIAKVAEEFDEEITDIEAKLRLWKEYITFLEAWKIEF